MALRWRLQLRTHVSQVGHGGFSFEVDTNTDKRNGDEQQGVVVYPRADLEAVEIGR